jgi:poly(A) polymerase
MVAKVCQLYPKAAAPRIVSRFFWLMSNWRWPDPVRLQLREDAPLQLREWDPNTSYHDRKHLMPIITPAYPSMNSTHNIGPSTFKVLMRELKRGLDITNEITGSNTKPWKELFQKHTFFTKDYKHYLMVVSASHSKEAQQAWSGLCQARLRRLIMKVEELQGSVELAHPFNKGIERVHECLPGAQTDTVLQGGLDYQVKESETTETAGDVQTQAAAQTDAEGMPVPAANGENATETASDGKHRIYTTTYYVGIDLKPNQKSLDISYAIHDYKNIVTSADVYNPETNSIRVTHVRKYVIYLVVDDEFLVADVHTATIFLRISSRKARLGQHGLRRRRLLRALPSRLPRITNARFPAQDSTYVTTRTKQTSHAIAHYLHDPMTYVDIVCS